MSGYSLYLNDSVYSYILAFSTLSRSVPVFAEYSLDNFLNDIAITNSVKKSSAQVSRFFHLCFISRRRKKNTADEKKILERILKLVLSKPPFSKVVKSVRLSPAHCFPTCVNIEILSYRLLIHNGNYFQLHQHNGLE